MSVPAITVLLPFFQSHSTLDRAVSSVVDQTFRHWEMILIDNNADVASREIAQSWQRRDDRIRVVHESHQGIAYALNKGLTHVNSKYVARMDADDACHPLRLEKQFAFLESHNEIALVSCRCRFESNSINADGFREFVDWQNNILTPEQHFTNRFIESPVAHPSVMFRFDLITRFGLYATEKLPEDYELWLRWMANGVGFAKLEDELLTWHDSENRLSRVHPNYSVDAFFETKMKYLADWINTNVGENRRLVVCGTGKLARARAASLEKHGITVDAFTDIKPRGTPPEKFIPIEKLSRQRDAYFVNFISKRRVRDDIRRLFNGMGFREPDDFILAA